MSQVMFDMIQCIPHVPRITLFMKLCCVYLGLWCWFYNYTHNPSGLFNWHWDNITHYHWLQGINCPAVTGEAHPYKMPFNSLWLSNTTFWSTLFTGKSLAHCHIITWNNINYWGLNDYCQLNPEGYIPMKFYLKFKSFHSLGFGNVICRVAAVFCSDLRGLTHCGLVKPYGNIDLDQAIWQYRAGSTLDWSNDFVPDSIKPLPELTLTSSVKSTDNQLRAISQDNSAINYYNHKAITWTNVDPLSVWSCTIHLRAISQKIP